MPDAKFEIEMRRATPAGPTDLTFFSCFHRFRCLL